MYVARFVVCSCRISGSVSGFARMYPPPTRSVRARPRSCSSEAPALNHGRNARVANPTKRAPIDATRADRASAAQPTVEVAATGRRRARAICHTERTSARQNVQASAEWSGPCGPAGAYASWLPRRRAAPVCEIQVVQAGGMLGQEHPRTQPPPATLHHPSLQHQLGARCERRGAPASRGKTTRHDALPAQRFAAAYPASSRAGSLVMDAPTVADACGVSGCASKRQSKRQRWRGEAWRDSIEAVCRCSMRTFSVDIAVNFRRPRTLQPTRIVILECTQPTRAKERDSS